LAENSKFFLPLSHSAPPLATFPLDVLSDVSHEQTTVNGPIVRVGRLSHDGIVSKQLKLYDHAVLWPVHTGDYSRRFICRRFRRQSPVLATVAEFGDYSRQCGQAIRPHDRIA